MPDPLDPADAIVSAFTDIWKRSGAFLAVTAGAAFLGWNAHNTPNVFSSFSARGFGAVQDVYQSIDSSLIAGWFGMMVHSVFILWTLPFVLGYLWLLVRLWRDGDLFEVLFFLALSHSAHTFVYLQRVAPLSGGALAGGIAALLVAEGVTVALVLWWRHVSETAPEVPSASQDAEPEL